MVGIYIIKKVLYFFHFCLFIKQTFVNSVIDSNNKHISHYWLPLPPPPLHTPFGIVLGIKSSFQSKIGGVFFFMRKWTSITLISFSPVYSFRVSYFSFRKIQVKNIIKNANCVYPLALVWNWANSVDYIFPKWRKHLPSLFDIVSHVDTMQHLHSAGAAPHSFFPTPIVCNWYSGNRKPLELVWGQRRMTMRLWISWSRCHCTATTTTTQSRHCSQCLSQASCRAVWHFSGGSHTCEQCDLKQKEVLSCQCAHHPGHPQRKRYL